MHTPFYHIKEMLEHSYPFWKHLSDAQKERLISGSRQKIFDSGSFVHSRSEECLGVFLVLSGQIRAYIQSEEGREVTLFCIEQGEVCTLSAACMMREISFDIFIEALEESSLLITNASCIHSLMKDNIYVENYIYRQTAERFSDVMWSMGQLLFSSMEKRLAAYLADEQVKAHSNTILTTHEQIAKHLGTAREVVSRTLKFLEKEGIVILGRKSVTIADSQKLKKLLA